MSAAPPCSTLRSEEKGHEVMMLIYETEADFSARSNEQKDVFWGAYH
jgi:hypothetical protein